MNNNTLKKKYFLCASVAFYNSLLFGHAAWKVTELAPIIKKLFENQDEVSLQFYETFFLGITAEEKNLSKRDMYATSIKVSPTKIFAKKNPKQKTEKDELDTPTEDFSFFSSGLYAEDESGFASANPLIAEIAEHIRAKKNNLLQENNKKWRANLKKNENKMSKKLNKLKGQKNENN